MINIYNYTNFLLLSRYPFKVFRTNYPIKQTMRMLKLCIDAKIGPRHAPVNKGIAPIIPVSTSKLATKYKRK